MKKLTSLSWILLILLTLILLAPAKPAEAGRRGGGGFLPGLIIGGVLGWGLAPRYYPPRYYYPPPAYYYPPPVYHYPPPETYDPPSETYENDPPPRESDRISPSTGRIFIYPRQGQSQRTQEKDRQECHRWAVDQTGYDSSISPEDGPDNEDIQSSSDYFRAISACLEARGYTVR